MSLCVVYLASPRAAFGGQRLAFLQTSIEITRKILPTTDIIVFHEDLKNDDLQSYVKLVNISFEGHEKYFKFEGHHRGYGYFMMCRFFSGILQRHQAIQKYTHYMRLDDDSYFIKPCDIDLDSLLKYDYVYRTTFQEESFDQTVINKVTEAFLHKRGMKMPTFNKQLAPYNNFHVSSLALWKHPLVREYIDEIEERHLILTDGCLDANIHAHIIWAILPNTSLKLSLPLEFGYRHNLHVSIPGMYGYSYMNRIPFMPEHTNVETMEELAKY